MITGFNTDVKHNAKVYHVQTEDKGRNNPKIESLVYVGGEILDNYRTSYEASRSEISEDDIMELLEAQHKRVIRSIKLGRYDESAPFEEGLITDRSLDEVVTDYLSNEPCSDTVKLTTNGLATLFREQKANLEIDAMLADAGTFVEDCYVRIKLVAPDHCVMVLGRGVTNGQGHVSVKVRLPNIPLTNGKLIVQGISEIGVAEHQYPLR